MSGGVVPVGNCSWPPLDARPVPHLMPRNLMPLGPSLTCAREHQEDDANNDDGVCEHVCDPETVRAAPVSAGGNLGREAAVTTVN